MASPFLLVKPGFCVNIDMRTEQKDEYGLTSGDYNKVDISGLLDAQKMARRVLKNKEAQKQKAKIEDDRAARKIETTIARDEARDIDMGKSRDVMGQVIDNARKLSDLRGIQPGFYSPSKTDNRQRELIPQFVKREIFERVQKVLDECTQELGVDTIRLVNDGVSLGSLKDFKDSIETVNGKRIVHRDGIADGSGRIDVIRSSNDMYSVNAITIEIIFGADKGSQTFNLNVSELWDRIRAALVKPVDSSDNLNNLAKKEYLRKWNKSLTNAVDKSQSNMMKTGDVSVGRLDSIAKTMTSHGIKHIGQNKNPVNTKNLTNSIVNGEMKRIENNYLENNRIYLLDGLAKIEKVYYRENSFRHITFRWVDVYAS